MPRRKKSVLLSLIVIAALLLCVPAAALDSKILLLPVGRSLEPGNTVDVSIDSRPYKAGSRSDGCGGSWIWIPFADLKGSSVITLTITRTNPDAGLREESMDVKRWTASNRLIDSDNPAIVSKSREMVQGKIGVDEKARAIFRFVQGYMQFKLYRGMHRETASATLSKGYGICVNYSRLFIALCRAAGIPARSVAGGILGDKGVFYHHEWVEFFDERNFWRPLDLNTSKDFDFTDLKRIDLLYDVESNPMYPFEWGWENDRVNLNDLEVSVFCPDWEAQKRDGRLGYTLSEDRSPDSVTASAKYRISNCVR